MERVMFEHSLDVELDSYEDCCNANPQACHEITSVELGFISSINSIKSNMVSNRLRELRFFGLTASTDFFACFFQDARGDLWLCTNGSGLYRLKDGRARKTHRSRWNRSACSISATIGHAALKMVPFGGQKHPIFGGEEMEMRWQRNCSNPAYPRISTVQHNHLRSLNSNHHIS